jgi:8-oxo-dGTP pyrophosphatase MutT (NUDIX family)/gamma-glutamylcyclotransferase (GGCT)/AIG2-like uncharacterized protein YtfP
MSTERFQLIPAAHLFLIREGQVLLLRRYNTGYEDGNYSVVAGHLDGNEEVKTAMIREAREEAGIEIRPEDLQVVGIMHRKSTDERVDFFLATEKWSGEVTNTEPDKCDELRWVPLDQLPENVIPYIRKAIENYRNGVWFDSYGWEDATQVEATTPDQNESCIDVFVYGTLLTGERNHYIAAPHVKSTSPGAVRGCMYNVGRYPAMVLEAEGAEIPGEWFRVTQEGLKQMDLLEEYYGPDQDNEYERVWVEDISGDRKGYTYVWKDHRGCPPIAENCWRTHRQKTESESGVPNDVE